MTARKMYEHCETYFDDLGPRLDLPLRAWWDEVRRIPYIEDPEWREVVARPKYLLDRGMFPALDCKKKAILIGSYLAGNGIPYRFVGSWESEDFDGVHHVFPQGQFPEGWVNLDATYPSMRFGAVKNVIEAEVFER